MIHPSQHMHDPSQKFITDRIKSDRHRERHSASTRAVSARIAAKLLRRSDASQWTIVSGGAIAATTGGTQAILTAPCPWTAMEFHSLLAEIPRLTLPLSCPCSAASGYYQRHGDEAIKTYAPSAVAVAYLCNNQ